MEPNLTNSSQPIIFFSFFPLNQLLSVPLAHFLEVFSATAALPGPFCAILMKLSQYL